MSGNEVPVVVITGAAGRLGRQLVDGYLGAGYQVVGLDRDVPSDGAVQVVWMAVDVLDERSVGDAFEAIVDRFGGIHVLVHTVGMWGMAPLAETTLEAFSRMIDVNLTSTFLCFREAVRRMAPRGGRLIGITSRQGSEHGVAGQGAYSAAKAGVLRMVESVADEYGASGLTAHAIAPSTILFGDETSGGVRVEDLVSACLYVSGPAGAALNGSVLRAFGT